MSGKGEMMSEVNFPIPFLGGRLSNRGKIIMDEMQWGTSHPQLSLSPVGCTI